MEPQADLRLGPPQGGLRCRCLGWACRPAHGHGCQGGSPKSLPADPYSRPCPCLWPGLEVHIGFWPGAGLPNDFVIDLLTRPEGREGPGHSAALNPAAAAANPGSHLLPLAASCLARLRSGPRRAARGTHRLCRSLCRDPPQPRHPAPLTPPTPRQIPSQPEGTTGQTSPRCCGLRGRDSPRPGWAAE